MGHSEAFHSPCREIEQEILNTAPTRAIEKIMDLYGDEIKRLIYTYVKNTADTDDVTQEVFVTVYKKLDTFKGQSSLRSWIYSIAINKAKDHLRSWQSRNKRLKDRLIQSARVKKDTSDSPEDHTLKQSEFSSLLNQVMGLPIKYREVIVLHYFKELSTKEIADALSMKEVSVRTRLKRGRDKLKQLLSAERGVTNG
ncbi:sigma-70 family RNA polymerase sigma factor [Virgibacillus kekensis]|uniref:RNA polymerase sigma factor n=1 Tax=Virgibacillus kekensis TaxID=202261 RepID=A0ABV9DJZ9_9BACI